jgi:hypothetical protein
VEAVRGTYYWIGGGLPSAWDWMGVVWAGVKAGKAKIAFSGKRRIWSHFVAFAWEDEAEWVSVGLFVTLVGAAGADRGF